MTTDISATVCTPTQSLPRQDLLTAMATTLSLSRFAAPTRLHTRTTKQGGPCACTVGLLQRDLYARAWQVGELAEQYISLHQMDLDPRIINGFYLEETQLSPRLRGVQCRCSCKTCDIQGNDLRIMRDFTDTARRIAQEDVHAFLAGTRPTQHFEVLCDHSR